MEQRHITGKSHWYHETQSSTAEYDVLPLVPEAAKVSDPFLLDVILDEETLAPLPFMAGPCARSCSGVVP